MSLLRALCQAFELDLSGATPPEWVQLLPAGPKVEGRDGRKFTVKDMAAIIAAFRANGADLPIDLEHATELKAPNGEPAPAAGWIRELEDRPDGTLWARVGWTPSGAKALEAPPGLMSEYRYLSPVLWHDKKGNVVAIDSAALVNKPNLRLQALNRAEAIEEKLMNPEILKLLGLPEDATDDQVLTAIKDRNAQLETAKAANSAQPDLTKFVPRATFDEMETRACNAEAKLADKEKSALSARIDAAIKKGMAAKKISPATEDLYRSLCRTEDDLAKVEKFVETAPPVVSDTTIPGAPPAGSTSQLDETSRAVCSQLGISEEDFAKTRKELEREQV